MGQPTREITLEVEPDSEPIYGRVRDDSGIRTFYGWLGLAEALRAALSAAEDRANAGGGPAQ